MEVRESGAGMCARGRTVGKGDFCCAALPKRARTQHHACGASMCKSQRESLCKFFWAPGLVSGSTLRIPS